MKNGSEKIDKAFFESFIDLLEQREGCSKAEYDKLQKVFERFDTDSNGYLDDDELHAVFPWLGFYTEVDITRELLIQACKESGLEYKINIGISLDFFRFLMRKHRCYEYNSTKQVFDRLDTDADGIIAPEELWELFKQMQVELTPEALVETVDACKLDGEQFSFTCFWKALQYLRDRTGFTSSECERIRQVFNLFDTAGYGELPARRVQHALRWLGFLLDPKDPARQLVDWRGELRESGRVSLDEFRSLVRRYQMADLQSTRSVFRYYADNGGAEPLPKKNLRKALKRINETYLDDAQAWLRDNLPSKWQADEDIGFDFEEFRRLVAGCQEKVCDRLHENQGFTDLEVCTLRVAFVKHAKDGIQSTLSEANQAALFASLIPGMEKDTVSRNNMKRALEVAKCKKGQLTWSKFLLVMRTHRTLEEEEEDAVAPQLAVELDTNREGVEHFFDIYGAFVKNSLRGDMSPNDLRLLLGRERWSADDGRLKRLKDALLKCQASPDRPSNLNAFKQAVKRIVAESAEEPPSPPPSSPAGKAKR